MKFLIVALALVAVAAAQYADKPIAILREASDIAPDGSYAFSFETENGIARAESGAPKAAGPEGPAVVVEGQSQYTAPDGTPIQTIYAADENGYRAQGSHIPVAPPIPEAILRSIAWNEAHPEEDESAAYYRQ